MTLGRPAKGLPRYYMDVGWYQHPRFVGLPVEALFVFEAAVGYCTKHATDGEIPAHPEDLAAVLGLRASVVRKALKPLIEREALEPTADGLFIRGWADHNPTAAEVEQHTQIRSGAGSYGNHVRWHQQRSVVDPECQWCSEPSDDIATDRNSDRTSDPPTDRTPIAQSSLGMGWDGMGTDELKSASNSRPPATTPAGRPESDPPPQDTNTLLTAAATILANAERDRRQAKGELDNPTGYRNSRIDPLRRENEQFWWLILGENPSTTARQLADAVLETHVPANGNGHKPDPTSGQREAARRQQETGLESIKQVLATPRADDETVQAAIAASNGLLGRV